MCLLPIEWFFSEKNEYVFPVHEENQRKSAQKRMNESSREEGNKNKKTLIESHHQKE